MERSINYETNMFVTVLILKFLVKFRLKQVKDVPALPRYMFTRLRIRNITVFVR